MSSEQELHLHPFEEEVTLIHELDEASSDSDVQKLTLYNLEISLDLSKSIVQFLEARLRRIRASASSNEFVLELLGCTGYVDRVLEFYASGLVDEAEEDEDADDVDDDERFHNRDLPTDVNTS